MRLLDYFALLGFLTTSYLFPGMLGCSCPSRQLPTLREQFCISDYGTPTTVVQYQCVCDAYDIAEILRTDAHVLEVLVTGNEIIVRPDHPLGMIRGFAISTTKVYKGTHAYDEIDPKNYIYSAVTCGISLEIGTKYVVLGRAMGGLIQQYRCQFNPIKLDELTAEQKDGLESTYPRCQDF